MKSVVMICRYGSEVIKNILKNCYSTSKSAKSLQQCVRYSAQGWNRSEIASNR